MHTHTQTHAYPHSNTRIPTLKHTHTHTQTHAYPHSNTRIPTHKHTHTHTLTHAYPHSNTRIPTLKHTHTCTYRLTRTHLVPALHRPLPLLRQVATVLLRFRFALLTSLQKTNTKTSLNKNTQ